MRSVTLADVAARAGVSVSTVSRVLSSARRVSPDVAKRVRIAADELRYSTNSIARALRTQQTDTIGMVVPSLLNPFFSALVDGMEGVLQAEGKQLLLCDSRQDPALEARHLRALVDRYVDGIVVSPCHVDKSREMVIETAKASPLVQLDRRVAGSSLDWVGIDDDEALRLIVAHLAERGAASAAFVASAPTNSSTRDRLRGFQRYVAEFGIRTYDEWIVLEEYTVDSGTRAAYQLLDRGRSRPDAIVCADDLIAYGVLHATRALGISVPGELQVTGFDDLVFSEHVAPRLTSISQPTSQIAEEALRLLVRRTGEPEHPGSSIALAPELVVRDSTRGIVVS